MRCWLSGEGGRAAEMGAGEGARRICWSPGYCRIKGDRRNEEISGEGGEGGGDLISLAGTNDASKCHKVSQSLK